MTTKMTRTVGFYNDSENPTATIEITGEVDGYHIFNGTLTLSDGSVLLEIDNMLMSVSEALELDAMLALVQFVRAYAPGLTVVYVD